MGDLKLVVHNKTISADRTTALVHLRENFQDTTSDSLEVHRAPVRDDSPPLGDSGGTDIERPRNLRGVVLKVIQNSLLKHDSRFTTVKTRVQPELHGGHLTSVSMEKLTTISERLSVAMKDADVHPSGLARECGVSPAAVHKWQNGGKLSADSLAAAARALGVREEWLRTGKLPRERESAEEDAQVDRVFDLLSSLQGPLAELANAIEKLNRAKQDPRKRHKA